MSNPTQPLGIKKLNLQSALKSDAQDPKNASILPKKLNISTLKLNPAQNSQTITKTLAPAGAGSTLQKLMQSTQQNKVNPLQSVGQSLLSQKLGEKSVAKQQQSNQADQLVVNPKVVQEFWLEFVIQRAFVPNKLVDQNQKVKQAVVRATLLQQDKNSFAALRKANPDQLSTIQHETITDLNAKVAMPQEYVSSIITQPQPIFANSEFLAYFKNVNVKNVVEKDIPKNRINKDYFLLDIDDFPISNSAVVKFLNEKLIVNDKQDNIADNAFALLELIQLPSWGHAQEIVLGWTVFKFSELMRRQGQQIKLQLFENPKGKNLSRFYPIMTSMFENEKGVDVETIGHDEISVKQVFQKQDRVKPVEIGILELAFEFLQGDKIVQERNVRKYPVYPYDHEINAAEIQGLENEEKNASEQRMENIVDLTKIDSNVKQYMDQLHQQSLKTPNSNVNFNEDVNCTAFASASTSAIAACPVGNIALGAAAVLTKADAYNIVLFNIITGQALVTLGTHYGYVYQMKFSADGLLLMTCSADGTILFFDVKGFVYYGFNFYYKMKQDDANKTAFVINRKRIGTEKLNDVENEKFNQFTSFIQQDVNRNLSAFQFGDFMVDLEILDVMTRLSNECSCDLNKMMEQISNDMIQELQDRFLVYQISEGVCVYDISQVNAKIIEFLNLKQVGVMHDLRVKRQFVPIDIQFVSGNLSSTVNFHRIFHQEHEKKPIITKMIVVQHNDYVNCIRTNQLKAYCLIMSADVSGTIKFTQLSMQSDKPIFKQQHEIQTQAQLKDFITIKTKTKDVLIFALNAYGCLQAFDESGTSVLQLNQQIQEQQKQMQNPIQFLIQKTAFPGNCHMTTNNEKTCIYIPVYGGGIIQLSPAGRIMQQTFCFKQIQFGCFVSAIVQSSFGILAGFNLIAHEGKDIIGQFTPAGVPKYTQVPLTTIGCGYGQRKFQEGIVTGGEEIEQKEQQKKDQTQQGAQESKDTKQEVKHEEEAGDDVNVMVQKFMTYISDQRTRMNE